MSNVYRIEQLLVFTGRMQALQKSISEVTQKQILPLPDKFDKAILENSFSQVISTPDYLITPTTLTEALNERISRLSYPTRSLQIRGRNLTVGVLSWAGLNMLAGYWGFMFSYVDAGTALGLAGLLGTAGLRIAIGRWEKAKLRWLADYKRVIDGLKRDLHAALNKALESQVFVTQTGASESILAMAEKRRQETKKLEADIDALVSETAALRK